MRGYCVKACLIIGVFGAHPLVPPGKVETKITRAFFVVHIVMSNRGHVLENGVSGGIGREQFIATMPQCIFENHHQENGRQCRPM